VLRVIKKEVIDVVIGQYGDGSWYATTPDVPWLAAEGGSQKEVMVIFVKIAPILIDGLHPNVPYQLKWHAAEINK